MTTNCAKRVLLWMGQIPDWVCRRVFKCVQALHPELAEARVHADDFLSKASLGGDLGVFGLGTLEGKVQ